MKKLIYPSSILMYILSLFVFFLAGMTYAGLTGASKGQGLAAGAIVIFYGFSFAFVALIVSFFLAWHLDRLRIRIINKILVALLAGFLVYLGYRILMNEKKSEIVQIPETIPVTRTAGFSNEDNPMGIGMVKPVYLDHPTMYFYGSPEFRKPVSDHSPCDSLVLEASETGLAVNYAPPWLLPEYMKLDYELLLFKATGLADDFIEIEVNRYENRTAFVDRRRVIFMEWKEFLLQVHSVEQLFPQDYPVRIKPISHGGLVGIDFAFLKPVLIRAEWMKVELINDDYEEKGEDWIQWNKDGKLLIRYALLS